MWERRSAICVPSAQSSMKSFSRMLTICEELSRRGVGSAAPQPSMWMENVCMGVDGSGWELMGVDGG